MKKEKAILFGPVIGEMAWEFMRFSPLIPHYHNKYSKQNVKFIVFTRPDRFDMYGQYADILVPLRIEGDGTKFKADCFRMMGYSVEEYKSLARRFNKKYSKRFEIISHFYPTIDQKKYAQKFQFPKNNMKFKWKPRKENSLAIGEYISNDKKNIILAPRFRNGLRRNWPHWNEFYDILGRDEQLMTKYNFVICGKNPDYIPDKKNRFYDINKIKLVDEISLIGLTIESINRSILTVGSQSGIPNMAMMMGGEVLEWGHQRGLHTRTYNIKKAKIHFLDDMKYQIEPLRVFEKMKRIIYNIEEGGEK